jgi:hypothetical protein
MVSTVFCLVHLSKKDLVEHAFFTNPKIVEGGTQTPRYLMVKLFFFTWFIGSLFHKTIV